MDLYGSYSGFTSRPTFLNSTFSSYNPEDEFVTITICPPSNQQKGNIYFFGNFIEISQDMFF